jgi:hypothetical protein
MEVENNDMEVVVEGPEEEEKDQLAFEEDEMKIAFDNVDSLTTEGDKITEFQKLLQSSRSDDNALKIKEQCIYRFASILSV